MRLRLRQMLRGPPLARMRRASAPRAASSAARSRASAALYAASASARAAVIRTCVRST